VRQFADTRTPQQDSLAKYWAAPTGSLTAGLWNTIVAKQIVSSKLTERAAARTLALINTAGTDGVIACHDSKYQYWLLRPSQADAGIKLAIGLPNHPSYPSNHACISGSVGYVMGYLFPTERVKYSDLATEASISRLYGGIHYRFDMDSGLAIARKITALVRDADRRNALLSMLP
jgi:membrane-associated phospholipid phosphatase